MRLSFDSIEEVREFVKGLKGTRGGKTDAEDGEKAPAPAAPPAGGPATAFNPGQGGGPTGLAPPAGGATQAASGPFAAGATNVEPAIAALAALVTRINAAIDRETGKPGADMSGALNWFKGECQKAGLDATNADMAQIKAHFLPKLPVPVLENIAKLMAA